MNRAEFTHLEAEARRLVGLSGATAAGLKQAFAPLAARLSPEEKVSAAVHFARRDGRVRAKAGSGDWLAWYFVHGAIRGAAVLPWTQSALTTVLEAVVEASQALPPEFVARAVEQFAKREPLDDSTRRLVASAANSLWPKGSTEGTNFKKAAAKLRALAKRRKT